MPFKVNAFIRGVSTNTVSLLSWSAGHTCILLEVTTEAGNIKLEHSGWLVKLQHYLNLCCSACSAASLQNSEQSLFTGSTRNKLLLTSVEGWDYNLMWIKWPWMGSKPFMLLHPSPSSPAPFSKLTDKTNISGASKI